MQGRLVKDVMAGAAAKGEQTASMNVGDLANGIYQLQFRTQSGVSQLRKVTVRH